MIDDDAFTKPSYWRNRAHAAQALADGFRLDENKLALQALAEKFEAMAVWAERQATPTPAQEHC